MSARRSIVQVLTKSALLAGAVFLVSVLLAAMPGHHPPVGTAGDAQAAAPAAKVPTQKSLEPGNSEPKDTAEEVRRKK